MLFGEGTGRMYLTFDKGGPTTLGISACVFVCNIFNLNLNLISDMSIRKTYRGAVTKLFKVLVGLVLV